MTVVEYRAEKAANQNTTTPEPDKGQSKFVVILVKASRAIRRWFDSRRNKSVVLLGKVTFRETLTAILLMIPSAGTVMLTFYGVSIPLAEQGGDITQKGQALAFALTIGVFSWLTWFFLFGLAYRLRGKRLAAALVAGTISIGSIASVDAPYNTLALGSGTAVQLTLVDTADYYEVRNSVVFERATTAQRLLPALTGQAERFGRLQTGEEKYGTYSGSRGPGKVSESFGQVATLLGSLTRELKLGLAEAKSMQSGISGTLSKMKRATFARGPIRPRVEIVSVAADQLGDQLGRLKQLDFAVSIKATLATLTAVIPAPAQAKSNLEIKQNEALAVIGEMAKPVAKALQAALDELNTIEAPTLEKVRPQDAMTAIFSKWREIFPSWAAALFIDLGPAFLLVILIAAYREAEVAADESPVGEKTTLHQK